MLSYNNYNNNNNENNNNNNNHIQNHNVFLLDLLLTVEIGCLQLWNYFHHINIIIIFDIPFQINSYIVDGNTLKS